MSGDAKDGDELADFGYKQAVFWGTAMALNLAWPRQEIYNATEPFHWYLQWGAFLFIGVVALGGFAYYWLVQRHKSGVLADHAWQEQVAESPSPATSGVTEPLPG